MTKLDRGVLAEFRVSPGMTLQIWSTLILVRVARLDSFRETFRRTVAPSLNPGRGSHKDIIVGWIEKSSKLCEQNLPVDAEEFSPVDILPQIQDRARIDKPVDRVSRPVDSDRSRPRLIEEVSH